MLAIQLVGGRVGARLLALFSFAIVVFLVIAYMGLGRRIRKGVARELGQGGRVQLQLRPRGRGELRTLAVARLLVLVVLRVPLVACSLGSMLAVLVS